MILFVTQHFIVILPTTAGWWCDEGPNSFSANFGVMFRRKERKVERRIVFLFSFWFVSSSCMGRMVLSTNSVGANFKENEHVVAGGSFRYQIADTISDGKNIDPSSYA